MPTSFSIIGFGDHRQELPVEPERTEAEPYIDTNMFR